MTHIFRKTNCIESHILWKSCSCQRKYLRFNPPCPLALRNSHRTPPFGTLLRCFRVLLTLLGEKHEVPFWGLQNGFGGMFRPNIRTKNFNMGPKTRNPFFMFELKLLKFHCSVAWWQRLFLPLKPPEVASVPRMLFYLAHLGYLRVLHYSSSHFNGKWVSNKEDHFV